MATRHVRAYSAISPSATRIGALTRSHGPAANSGCPNRTGYPNKHTLNLMHDSIDVTGRDFARSKKYRDVARAA